MTIGVPTITAIAGVTMTLLGGFATFRANWAQPARTDAQQVIDTLQAALKDERSDCKEHLDRLEKRLDACEEKHTSANEMIIELASRMGMPELARRARSLSPPPMEAVKEPRP